MFVCFKEDVQAHTSTIVNAEAHEHKKTQTDMQMDARRFTRQLTHTHERTPAQTQRDKDGTNRQTVLVTSFQEPGVGFMWENGR